MYTSLGVLERYAEGIEEPGAKETIRRLSKGLRARIKGEVVLISDVEAAFAGAGFAGLVPDFKSKINGLIKDREIDEIEEAIRGEYSTNQQVQPQYE